MPQARRVLVLMFLLEKAGPMYPGVEVSLRSETHRSAARNLVVGFARVFLLLYC